VTTEDEVRAAVNRFYEAIDAMVSGKGLDAMREAWHHTDRVTTVHPVHDIAQGWDEVWATWEAFAPLGRADRGGSSVSNLRVQVYGDIAYTTCTFNVSPAFGGEHLSCTNVVLKKDGVWKIIHHHADKAPKMGAMAEKFATEL
jgi:ketosteroid isomerase-like protein